MALLDIFVKNRSRAKVSSREVVTDRLETSLSSCYKLASELPSEQLCVVLTHLCLLPVIMLLDRMWDAKLFIISHLA